MALAVEGSVRHSQYSVKMPYYLRQWGYPLPILASLLREGCFQYGDGKALGSPEAKAAVYLLTKYCLKNGVANVHCRPG